MEKKVVVLVRISHVFGGNATKQTFSMLLQLVSDVTDKGTVLSDLKHKIMKGNGKEREKKKKKDKDDKKIYKK